MTCIAWDGTTLAADKQTTINGLKIKSSKLSRIESGPYEGCIVGCAGTTTYCKEIVEWLESGAKKEDLPSFQKNENDSVSVILIDLDSRIWRLDVGSSFYEIEEPFHACGSGRDYAIATIALGFDSVKAVEIASKFCNTCGLGVDTLTL